MTSESAATIQHGALLEALRQALGARWVRLLPKDAPVEQEPGRGLLRKGEIHHLTVPVRGTDLDLVCTLGRIPTTEDSLIAGAVARSITAQRPERKPKPPGLAEAMAALEQPPERRAEAILEAALALTRSSAGGLAVVGNETRAWTHGPGKPVLRRAAVEASSGPEGRIEVADRRFVALPLTWNGSVVGGLAIETARVTDELRLFARAAAAALRPSDALAPPPSLAALEDLRSLLSAIPLPALAVNAKGQLLGASPEAEQLFGIVADFDLGLPVSGRLRSQKFEDLVMGRDTSEAEVVLGDRTFEPAVVPLASGGRVVTLHDRSHQETLQRIQEDLVASVAHELRTPIAAVKGLVELLKLRASKLEPGKLASLLADGEHEIARLERLVEDLLLAARVATGGIFAQPDVIDLRPIVEDVVRHATPRYPDRQFVVEGDAEAYADPALIRHVIWHLVDNAAKFGAERGTVTIAMRARRDAPEVDVTDEGEGIYSGDIPKLFQRFQQLDASATRQHGGAGLGLFLVKSILETTGGRVWVKSRLGRGSTFSFSLPSAPDDL